MAQEALLTIIIQAILVTVIVLSSFAYLTLAERQLIGRFQARRGPNRAGPFGFMQPLADLGKLTFKEDFVPEGANATIFRLAPLICVIAAVATLSVIP